MMMKKIAVLSLICLNNLSYGVTNSTIKDTTVLRLLNQLEVSEQDTFKVKLLNDLGLHLLRSNPEKSKKRAIETLQLSKELNYRKGIASAYNLLALNEEHVGNYTKSIEYYLKALEIIESEQDKEDVANLYHNIGKVYQYQQDFKPSSEYLIKGLKLYQEKN